MFLCAATQSKSLPKVAIKRWDVTEHSHHNLRCQGVGDIVFSVDSKNTLDVTLRFYDKANVLVGVGIHVDMPEPLVATGDVVDERLKVRDAVCSQKRRTAQHAPVRQKPPDLKAAHMFVLGRRKIGLSSTIGKRLEVVEAVVERGSGMLRYVIRTNDDLEVGTNINGPIEE